METITNKSNLENLPGELKMMILQNLTQQDLCTIALVSKSMMTVALDKNLWTELTLRLNETVMEKFKREGVNSLLLYCPRFRNLKSLRIKGNVSINSSENEDLILEFLLCKSISQLKSVELDEVHLSNQQLTLIVTEAAVFSDSLSELNLERYNLEELPIKLVCLAVSKLKTVNLVGETTAIKSLSTDQLVAILEESIKSKCLRKMNLSFNKLSNVPAHLIRKVVSKLNIVYLDLSHTQMSTEQITTVLEGSIESNSLTELNLDYNNMEAVPSGLLSKAISRLRKVHMCRTNMSTQHVIAMLQETINSNSLSELSLGKDRWLCLDVPAELLGKAISKLKKVDLLCEQLSCNQLGAIFEEIIESQSLKELNLRGTNLENVPVKVLSQAVSKLETADLSRTCLSTEQTAAILEETVKSSSLAELNLVSNDLKDVPKEVLSRSISRLERVNLSNTLLTTNQLVAIFEEIIRSKTLLELNLQSNKLTDVPTELIIKSIPKLKKVNLKRTGLENEQMEAIIEEANKYSLIINFNLKRNKLIN